MFKFNPKGQYMMPAHFGFRLRGRGPAPKYHEVTTIHVTYLTEAAALEQYLPESYELGAEPLVHVFYTMNRQVDWLAGLGYNLIGVNVPAVFNGRVDRGVAGTFCLVMWENDCDPIIAGRETLGIPKVFADIEDRSVIEGERRASAGLRGNKFLDIEVKDLEPVSQAVLAEQNARSGQGN